MKDFRLHNVAVILAATPKSAGINKAIEFVSFSRRCHMFT